MGAALPIVSAGMGAVGQISQMSSQRRQAAAQRKQVELNRIAARDQMELTQQRLAYSKDAATTQYFQERALLDSQKDVAQQNFQLATLQQTAANIQEEVGQRQFDAQLDGQVNQLLTASSNVDTQAALANSEVLNQLAVEAFGDRNKANAFMQRLALTNQTPEAFKAIQQASLLNLVARRQAGQEAVNTTNRVSSAQADALRSSASVTEQYGQLASDFMSVQRNANQQFQQFAQEQMPSLLELQHQRNISAAEAASYAKQAELSIASQASNNAYLNQERQARAQLSSIQSPSLLGSLAGIGQSLAPAIGSIMANRQPAQQSSSFGAWGDFSSPQSYAAPSVSGFSGNTVAAPMGGGQGMLTDVTGNVYG